MLFTPTMILSNSITSLSFFFFSNFFYHKLASIITGCQCTIKARFLTIDRIYSTIFPKSSLLKSLRNVDLSLLLEKTEMKRTKVKNCIKLQKCIIELLKLINLIPLNWWLATIMTKITSGNPIIKLSNYFSQANE